MASRPTPTPVDDWQNIDDWQDTGSAKKQPYMPPSGMANLAMGKGAVISQEKNPVKVEGDNPIISGIRSLALKGGDAALGLASMMKAGLTGNPGEITSQMAQSQAMDAAQNGTANANKNFVSGLFGVDRQALGEAARNRDYANLAVEAGSPLLQFFLLNKGMKGMMGDEALATKNPAAAENRLTFATGIADREMPAMVKRAMPELQKTGPRPGGLPQMISDTMNRLEGQFKSYLTPNKNVSVSTNSVADAIQKQLTSDIVKENPALADALQGWVNKFRNQTYTLDELNNLRQRYNADLAPFYNKGNLAQVADIDKSIATRKALNPASNAIRDLLYDSLERTNYGVSAQDIRNLKSSEGALMRMQEELGDRLQKVQAQANFDSGIPWKLRLRGNVRAYATTHGVGAHTGGIAEAIQPYSVAELNAVNRVGADVFQPRTSPFAPVNAAMIQSALSGKKR